MTSGLPRRCAPRNDGNGGVQQAVVGAGVQPGVAAAHDLHIQLAQLQVAPVHIGDFQLATG